VTDTTPRVVDLRDGVVMVVTDLHGDWSLYARYRDRFLELRAQGLAHTLVFTGDLIHSEGAPEADRSIDIVLDLMQLQEELGPALVVLLGNHEMPHIYHVILSKGDTVYTPRFEAVMGEDRAAVLRFFRACPFYLRTQAGVTLCHAGAFPEAQDAGAMAALGTFSHVAVLDGVAATLDGRPREPLRRAIAKSTGVPYERLAQVYLAVSGPEDPRYDDYLVGILAGYRDDFQLLWSALFSRNEQEQGMGTYTGHVEALLARLTSDFAPQRVVVTGHIGCRNGYRVLAGGCHLRVASGIHAHPYRSARYLLFDAAEPVTAARDLLSGLGSVLRS
jgi:hypothetical protein